MRAHFRSILVIRFTSKPDRLIHNRTNMRTVSESTASFSDTTVMTRQNIYDQQSSNLNDHMSFVPTLSFNPQKCLLIERHPSSRRMLALHPVSGAKWWPPSYNNTKIIVWFQNDHLPLISTPWQVTPRCLLQLEAGNDVPFKLLYNRRHLRTNQTNKRSSECWTENLSSERRGRGSMIKACISDHLLLH